MKLTASSALFVRLAKQHQTVKLRSLKCKKANCAERAGRKASGLKSDKFLIMIAELPSIIMCRRYLFVAIACTPSSHLESQMAIFVRLFSGILII